MKYNEIVSPMLLKEVDKPFNSDEYLYEIKYDGIRALVYVDPNNLKIISRNKKDISNLYPELQIIKKDVKSKMVLDGEIVTFENNKPSFSKLQQRMHLKQKEKILYQSKNNPVIYVVFDIIYLNKDLTNLTLTKRKKLLNNIKENDNLVISKTFSNGIKLFNNMKKLNMEGIVAKRKDSLYKINKRTNYWLKIKNIKDEKFFICAYKEKKNNYLSLLLGEKIEGKYYYVGSASITKNNPLYKKIIKQKIIKKTFFVNYKDNNAFYINPTIEVEVSYLQRTNNNHLRHPIIRKEKEK